MKLNFTRTFLVMAVAVLLYASCKKASVPPAVSTTKAAAVDYKTLSSTIGTQFYKSIIGQYGGTDVRKSITSPYSAQVAASKKSLFNSVVPLCGSVVDTTYNTKTGTNPFVDTIKTHFENLHFVYICDAGQVDGYLVRDSVVNVANHDLYIYDTNSVTQNYTVKALDKTYKLVSMDGSLDAYADTRNIEAPTLKSTATNYNLVGLRVNFASGTADVTAGTSSFTTTATDFGPQTNFQNLVTTVSGTIEYLGNHKVKVTFIPGASYIVDLITGVATPA